MIFGLRSCINISSCWRRQAIEGTDEKLGRDKDRHYEAPLADWNVNSVWALKTEWDCPAVGLPGINRCKNGHLHGDVWRRSG